MSEILTFPDLIETVDEEAARLFKLSRDAGSQKERQAYYKEHNNIAAFAQSLYEMSPLEALIFVNLAAYTNSESGMLAQTNSNPTIPNDVELKPAEIVTIPPTVGIAPESQPTAAIINSDNKSTGVPKLSPKIRENLPAHPIIDLSASIDPIDLIQDNVEPVTPRRPNNHSVFFPPKMAESGSTLDPKIQSAIPSLIRTIFASGNVGTFDISRLAEITMHDGNDSIRKARVGVVEVSKILADLKSGKTIPEEYRALISEIMDLPHMQGVTLEEMIEQAKSLAIITRSAQTSSLLTKREPKSEPPTPPPAFYPFDRNKPRTWIRQQLIPPVAQSARVSIDPVKAYREKVEAQRRVRQNERVHRRIT